MRFLPNNSRNYVSPFYYILTLITIVLFVTAWWFCCYKPLKIYINWYACHIGYLNRQKNQCLNNLSEYTVLNKEIKELSENIDKKICQASADELYNGLTGIIDCISKHDLTLISCIPEKVESKNWYMKVPFTFSLQGNFFQFVSFFKSIACSTQCIRCHWCEIKKNADRLNCKCILTFFVISKESEENNSEK